MEFTSKKEERRHRGRVRANKNLSLRMNGARTKLINLSRGGLQFLTDNQSPAQDMFLELRGTDHKQLLLATAVWSRSVGDGKRMLGVQITRTFPASAV